jgi:hypothetical protein
MTITDWEPGTKPTTPCREYRGPRTGRGYGAISRDGKVILLHRWVWEQINGPIPKGMVVMHLCDKPACFLYEHLRLGSQSDNIRDSRAKGRQVFVRPGAKLTWEQVVEIRAALDAGVHQKKLAEDYGVGQATISRIRNWQVYIRYD